MKKLLFPAVFAALFLIGFLVYRHSENAHAEAVRLIALQQDAAAKKAANDAALMRQVLEEQNAARRIKLLVTPFENGAAARSLSAMSLGLAAHVAERLEDDAYIEPINGDLVLTDAVAQLVDSNGKGYDLAKANALARARGATHFLTGRFFGQVWTWTFEVSLYAVAAGDDEPSLVGRGTQAGDLTDLVPTSKGRMVRTNSAKNIFGLMGKAVEGAFTSAGMSLAPVTATAIATPPTQDAFAFLKLSRAYVRYFGAVQHDGVSDTAVGLAKVAAIIDPKQAEAQRFFAALLLANNLPKLARIHYEFAIESRPTDVRSLIQLGKLELNADNPDIASGYLKRATEARPKDGDTFYWYAESLLKLGKSDEAVTALEKARTIQWYHADARKELANQYAARHRYADAAAELDVVATRILPHDPNVAFLEAACYRAAGNNGLARDVLSKAAERFPKESRMRKFRGDLYLHDGLVTAANEDYRAAARLNPNDARLRATLDGTAHTALPLGGDTLLAAITNATTDAAGIERSRSGFQKAVNDAIADLHYNKEAACTDNRAPSSALLAQQLGKEFQEVGGRFVGTTARISRALREGEGAALTPDESDAATKALTGAGVAESDAREMHGQYQYVFLPLYRQLKCDEYDGPVTPATVASVDARDADRQVELPVVLPPQYTMSFSPVIDPEQGRIIRFLVDNKQGEQEQVLTIDDKELGGILPGREMTFTTWLGYHRVCLLPKGQKCGEKTTIRVPFLSENWTIRVRPAK